MNKSLKCIIFLGLVVIILYFADITTIMKEAFDMNECVEDSMDKAPECQYRSSHKKKWKECNKKQQKKHDRYVNEVAGAKCFQKYVNNSWKTNYVIDEEEEHKNNDINHPNTLNWAVGETEEYLKEKREGDRLIKPIISWGPDRKLLQGGNIGASILDKSMGVKSDSNTFSSLYDYFLGEGEDDDDGGGYY
tara:strand:+ start:8531 stop:9103 length:573 start_codon:yes stop_codon:yes gene_type:complete